MSINLTNTNNTENQQKLAQGVFVNLFGKLFGRGAHLVSQIVLARLLGPVNFGLFGIGWNILRIIGIVSTLGLDSGVIHFGARYWKKDRQSYSDVVISALLSVLLMGSMAGLIVYLLANDISLVFNKPHLRPVLRGFVYAFPALAGVKVIASATRVTKNMRDANLIEEVVQPGINLVFIGLVFLIGGGLMRFVSANSASVIISLIIGFVILKSKYLTSFVSWRRILSQLKNIVSYSLPIAIPTVFGTLIILVDRILVGYFLTELDAGIYQSVSLVSVLFISILSAFKTIVAPMVAENFHRKEFQELKQVMRTSTRWVFNLCMPVFLVILIAPQTFMSTIFGEDYLLGSQALLILILAQWINISKGPVDQLLIMTENQTVWFKITVIAFLGNIAANLILIPFAGLIGAAIANLITFGGLAVGGLYFSKERLGFLPYDRIWLRSLGIALFTAGILIGFRYILSTTESFELLLISIASVAIYYGLMGWIGLTSDDRLMIGGIIKKISGRNI